MTESEDSIAGEQDSDDGENASLSDHMYYRRMLTDPRPKTLKFWHYPWVNNIRKYWPNIIFTVMWVGYLLWGSFLFTLVRSHYMLFSWLRRQRQCVHISACLTQIYIKYSQDAIQYKKAFTAQITITIKEYKHTHTIDSRRMNVFKTVV